MFHISLASEVHLVGILHGESQFPEVFLAFRANVVSLHEHKMKIIPTFDLVHFLWPVSGYFGDTFGELYLTMT